MIAITLKIPVIQSTEVSAIPEVWHDKNAVPSLNVDKLYHDAAVKAVLDKANWISVVAFQRRKGSASIYARCVQLTL